MQISDRRRGSDEAGVRGEVARRSQLTARDAGKAVDAFLETITDTLKSGGDVAFTGFGKFHDAAARSAQGVNPRNPDEKVAHPGRARAEVLGGQPAQGRGQGRLTARARSSEDPRAARAALVASAPA